MVCARPVRHCVSISADTDTGEALEAWAAQGALTLHTAFSRDGPDKIYVQQRVAETADALFSLLSVGAHFYVCGDASAMAVSRMFSCSLWALRFLRCPARAMLTRPCARFSRRGFRGALQTSMPMLQSLRLQAATSATCGSPERVDCGVDVRCRAMLHCALFALTASFRQREPASPSSCTAYRTVPLYRLCAKFERHPKPSAMASYRIVIC